MTVANASTAPQEKAETPEDTRPVVLSTHGLTKDFKNLRALDSLDLVVRQGDVFGFLGPNGAGKSTTIRLIFGLIYPTSGHVEILGNQVPRDRQDALRHVGGFVDDPTFYGHMSARRNLKIFGTMNGPVTEKRIMEVLDTVGLADRAHSRVGGYSHGMRQRLGIALALIHDPDLIILDEPTSGLDPQGMKDVRELIRKLGREGTTVFLSSHLLHEVELVCDRAAILTKGKMIAQGPVAGLRPASNRVKIRTSDQQRAQEMLSRLVPTGKVAADEGYLVIETDQGQIPEIVRQMVTEHIDVEAVIPANEQGLEQMFLELTGSDEPRVPGEAE